MGGKKTIGFFVVKVKIARYYTFHNLWFLSKIIVAKIKIVLGFITFVFRLVSNQKIRWVTLIEIRDSFAPGTFVSIGVN